MSRQQLLPWYLTVWVRVQPQCIQATCNLALRNPPECPGESEFWAANSTNPKPSWLCGTKLYEMCVCLRHTRLRVQVARFNKAVGLPTTLADLGVQQLTNYRLQQLVDACLVPDSTCWNVRGLNGDRMERAIMRADALGREIASRLDEGTPCVAVPSD